MVDELVRAFRPRIADAFVATDFDGTLAPLQVDPEASRLVPGARDALVALSCAGATVAVITGRAARTAVRLGGLDTVPGLVVAGLYGLEIWHDGTLDSPDEPAALTELRERLPAALAGGDPALWIEDKRLSLVVHARRAADPAAALAGIDGPVRELAGRLGLEAHPGSGVLELRLPGTDKASTLDRLAGDRNAVLYLGDDLGDLPAFEQVRRMRAAGRLAYGVAVETSAVPEVRAGADVAVADPAAAVALLAELAR